MLYQLIAKIGGRISSCSGGGGDGGDGYSAGLRWARRGKGAGPGLLQGRSYFAGLTHVEADLARRASGVVEGEEGGGGG